MSSIADEFLADLEEEEEEEEDEIPEQRIHHDELKEDGNHQSENTFGEKETQEQKEKVEYIQVDKLSFKNLNRLSSSDRLQSHIRKITEFRESGRQPLPGSQLLEDPEYPCIVASNVVAAEIDDEIEAIYKFLRDIYEKKFPELESNVPNPLDYVRVVKRIANATDLTAVDMSDILPQSVVIIIKVIASTTSGRPLEDEELRQVLAACDEVLKLDDIKKQILDYVASRMMVIAPNLSAIVGTTIAAQLIGAAGGLTALSKVPASNVQLLGKSKKTLIGFSARTQVRQVGYIGMCEIINNTPPTLRKRAGRLVSTKATLASRVDSFHQSSDGQVGYQLRSEIEEQIKKWQEPPPAKQEKPLPAPDDKPRKKRGGRRARKMKEAYKMTELRQKYNRMAFGVAEEEYQDTGKGLGMMKMEGSGSLRINAETKIKKKKPQSKGSSSTITPFYGGKALSGLSSSLVFTASQGIVLENPENALKRQRPSEQQSGRESVFTNPQFTKVKRQKSEQKT